VSHCCTALSAAIVVGGIHPHLGQLTDPRVVRRKVTHRIGRARVAGKREGLAATAAEKAERIGQLNMSPDLLQALLERPKPAEHARAR
jgi:hypothetical protein